MTFVFNVLVHSFLVPCGAMAAESHNFCSARGRREMRDITIETYSSDKGETRSRGLIPGSEGTDSAGLPLTTAEGLHSHCVIYFDPVFGVSLSLSVL
jgi:hypothetical protein